MANRRVQLERGYAADCAADAEGDGVWVAWAACLSDEESLLSEISRTWPVRPGVTPEAWRNRQPPLFTLTLTRLSSQGEATQCEEIARSASVIEGPVVVTDSGHGPRVVWIERAGETCEIQVWCDGKTERLASSGTSLHSPAAAMDGSGRLWVAWVRETGSGGEVDVWRAPLSDSGGTSPVSQPGTSNWSPALAADSTGAVWCAWDTWSAGESGNGGRYEIAVRRWLPSSHTTYATAGPAWETETRLRAGDDGFNISPSLAVDAEGKVWVAWSHSNAWGRLNHRFAHRRSIHVRVLDPTTGAQAIPMGHTAGGAVPLPVEAIDDPRQEEWVIPTAPKLVVGEAGIRLVYRRPEHAEYMGFGWGLWSVTPTGDGWSQAERLGTAVGFPDTPYGVVNGKDGALWAAAHACAYGHPVNGGERVTGTPSRRTFSKHAVSEDAVLVERVEEPAVAHVTPASVSLRTLNASSSGQTPGPAPQSPATVERSLARDGRKYELLFGDLHRHSAYSKCLAANDGDVVDHARWARDVGELDFYALTEHMEYMSYGEWRWTDRLASLLTRDSRVLALHGFETAIPPGHTNFFYVDERVGEAVRVAYLSSDRLEDIWPKLDSWVPEGSVLAIRHHQGHGQANVAQTFAPRYEPLVEIIQCRGEYRGWADRLLGLGLEAGFVGATDHAYAAAFPRGLTGVWAAERTRESVFSGLRARRTFATNGPKMRVFLSAFGVGMGERGTCHGAPDLELEMEGTTRLDRAELYRNGKLVHVEEIGERAATLRWRDGNAPQGRAYYYARVLQGREHGTFQPHYGVAYTSPVWLHIGAEAAG